MRKQNKEQKNKRQILLENEEKVAKILRPLMRDLITRFEVSELVKKKLLYIDKIIQKSFKENEK